MIKLLRKGTIENVWVLRIMILMISLAFVFTMGWFGFDGSSSQYVVASVGEVSIPMEQYQRAYDNAYRFYRDLLKDQFSEKSIEQLDLKNSVIHGLVEKQLWLKAAGDIGLEVSLQELSDFIGAREAFQRNGRFNTDVYRRVLAQSRMTPDLFEQSQKEDLLVEKVKNLVKTSASVTQFELQDVQKVQGSAPEASLPDPQYLYRNLLLHKQQLVLEAYLSFLKARTPITINEKML